MIRYENFLSDIAQKTQELITHNKSPFQEKVDDFISLYNYWKEQLLAGQREALKNKKKLYVGKMPDFRSKPYDFLDIGSAMKESEWKKSIEKKRPKGYILYNPYEIGFSNESDFMVEGIKGYYWGKPLPENPVDTLRIRKDSTILCPPYGIDFPKGHIQRKPVDEKEDLTRKYFLLAVIHANVGGFGIPIIDPKNEAAQIVWTMYRKMDGRKEDVWGNKIQNFITVAMKDVRANLKQCQRRTIHTIETCSPEQTVIPQRSVTNFASATESNINFERLEKYKTPKDYFLALDDFKRDPSNIKGGIVLKNPLFCFMDVIDWECGAIINRLKSALDFVKRKSAGENNIDDTIINNILRQTSRQISYLIKKIKRGYWGLKWSLLSEIRKILSSLSSSIFIKITRAPMNYVPEEFELMEKDLKTLNDTYIQHIELKETFGERLKKMSFEEAIKGLFERGASPQKKAGGGKAGDTTQGTPETTKLKGDPIRDQVFISYSHKDKRWLNDLQTHLKPYVRDESVSAWSDEQIQPGAKWFEELKKALVSTKVAVLLVTKDFLASDFIHEHELGPLLKEAEKGDVRIIWIPVRACAYKETPLGNYQAVIEPKKPLANMKAERDSVWVKICEEIGKAVNS